VSNLEEAERIAEIIRHEEHHVFRSDCIGKSIKFKRMCREAGIPVRIVVCLGIERAKPFGFWMPWLPIHAWGEVEGKRIEVSRPLGASGTLGTIPVNIRPLIAMWF